MLLYACQHYVNSCMNIFIHKIFPMLIIYHTRATVATICTLSMIPAIGTYYFSVYEQMSLNSLSAKYQVLVLVPGTCSIHSFR